MEVGCSWAVQYGDGTMVTRYRADGTESPWADIRWPDVTQVTFSSAEAETTFDFQHPGPAFDVRLGSRKGMTTAFGVRTLLLVTHLAGQPITDDTVVGMFYWFPDGSYHACDLYNCPEAQAYLHALVHGDPVPPLPQDHAHLPLGATAALA